MDNKQNAGVEASEKAEVPLGHPGTNEQLAVWYIRPR